MRITPSIHPIGRKHKRSRKTWPITKEERPVLGGPNYSVIAQQYRKTPGSLYHLHKHGGIAWWVALTCLAAPTDHLRGTFTGKRKVIVETQDMV
jgi:hypothetical protein